MAIGDNLLEWDKGSKDEAVENDNIKQKTTKKIKLGSAERDVERFEEGAYLNESGRVNFLGNYMEFKMKGRDKTFFEPLVKDSIKRYEVKTKDNFKEIFSKSNSIIKELESDLKKVRKIAESSNLNVLLSSGEDMKNFVADNTDKKLINMFNEKYSEKKNGLDSFGGKDKAPYAAGVLYGTVIITYEELNKNGCKGDNILEEEHYKKFKKRLLKKRYLVIEQPEEEQIKILGWI